MIRIYSKENNFYVKSGDLNKFLETNEAFNLLKLRKYCTQEEMPIYALNFKSGLFYKVEYVFKACLALSQISTNLRMSKWKQTRIKALAIYLQEYTKGNNNYICVNE